MFPTGIVLRVMGQSAGVKPRPRHELVMRAVHPLVGPGVRTLARLGVEPWQVVVAHGALGLAAAGLVASSSPAAWAVAALFRWQIATLIWRRCISRPVTCRRSRWGTPSGLKRANG